ncbi:hypothetical protein CYY_009887 [Polysphondylium violaceum]|uniref:Uncharacterized protein n=1 Tax=Polysphondylium violaceum TaxID=133409 RepID=A0A8J4UVL6_9MYCE|nr:hypothetical protein CYY_009887 [Polysphondylium violaceum]
MTTKIATRSKSGTTTTKPAVPTKPVAATTKKTTTVTKKPPVSPKKAISKKPSTIMTKKTSSRGRKKQDSEDESSQEEEEEEEEEEEDSQDESEQEQVKSKAKPQSKSKRIQKEESEQEDSEEESEIELEFKSKSKSKKVVQSNSTPTKQKQTSSQSLQSTKSSQTKSPSKPSSSQSSRSSQSKSPGKSSSSQQSKKSSYNLKAFNIERLTELETYLDVELKEKLVKRLKKIDEFLQNKKQGERDGLDLVIDCLTQKAYLKHKLSEVRLLVSCCLAEVFRICIPHIPFEGSVLKEVFDLFIEQVTREKVDSKLFPQYFQMLERLAIIKVFAILGHVDMDMVAPFFKACLKNVLGNESAGDESQHPMDIMYSTLMGTVLESLDEINNDIWSVLIESLLEREGDRPSVKAEFTQELISTNANYLRPHFQVYMQEEMFEATSTNPLKKKRYDIIYEIFAIHPSMVYCTFPLLEFDLEDASGDVRRGVVRILAHIYCSDIYEDVIEQSTSLYSTFLNRFRDIELKVRMIMMNFASHFKGTTEADNMKVLQFVHERLRDTEPDIRSKACKTISDYLDKRVDPKSITADFMNEFLERIKDREALVRKDAVISLAIIWRKIRLSNGPMDEWDQDLSDCFGRIPNNIFSGLGLYDDDKYRIEVSVDGLLLPDHKDIKNRAYVFLEIYKSFDESTKKILKTYLEEKNALRVEFLKLAEFLKSNTSTTTPSKSKSKSTAAAATTLNQTEDLETLLTRVDNFIPKFSHENTKKLLRSLLSQKKVFDYLVTVCDTDTTSEQLFNIKASIVASTNQKNAVFWEFVKCLVYKLGFSMIGKESIKYYLRSMRDNLGVEEDHMESQLDEKIYDRELKASNKTSHINSTMELMLALSNVFPQLFSSSADQLVLFLTCSKTVVYPTLCILQNISTPSDSNNNSSTLTLSKSVLKKTNALLLDLAQVAQPKIARLAFKTYIKIVTKQTELVQSLKDLGESLVSQLDDGSKNVLSILEVLGCISKYYFSLIQEYSDIIEKNIIKTIMTGVTTLDYSPKALSKSETAHYSKDAILKLAGIRYLANYLLGMPREKITKKSHEMVSFLFVFMSSLDKSKNYTDHEKVQLKLSISVALIKVFQKSPFEIAITPEQFNQLCMSASTTFKAKTDQILRKFFEKLTKYMKFNRLPPKYMAAFGMAAQQSNSLMAFVRKLSTSVIKTRRMIISRVAGEVPLKSDFYPESSFPYFLYIVAHREEFDRDNEYKETSIYLNYFIDLLVEESDNFSIIHATLTAIRKSNDTIYPESKANRIAAELGLQILSNQYANKKWKPQRHPVQIVLPPPLFTIPVAGDQDDKEDDNLQVRLPSELPKKFKLPALPQPGSSQDGGEHEDGGEDGEGKENAPPAIKKSPRKKRAPAKRKTKKESSSEEEEEENETDDNDSDDEQQVITTPSKRTSRTRNLNINSNQKDESDDDESDDDEEKQDVNTKKIAKRKPSSNGKEEYQDDQDHSEMTKKRLKTQ